MGKKTGIMVVETLTGEQDDNMDDDWEANILCEIENYEEKYGIDTYENEESVSELKDTIVFNVALNHVSHLKELSLSMNNSKLYGLLHEVQKIIKTETINNKKSLRQIAIEEFFK